MQYECDSLETNILAEVLLALEIDFYELIISLSTKSCDPKRMLLKVTAYFIRQVCLFLWTDDLELLFNLIMILW